MQLTEISWLWKLINKLKNWSLGILHFTIGRLVGWSERTCRLIRTDLSVGQNGQWQEANLKEPDWDNHMVPFQNSTIYLLSFFIEYICKWLTVSVFKFETMLVWFLADKSSLGYILLFTMIKWIDVLWCCCFRLNHCSSV